MPVSDNTAESANILTRPAATGGEGLDRRVEKQRLSPQRIGLIALVILMLGIMIWTLIRGMGGSRLTVDRSRLIVSEVEVAPFQEFVSINASVMPVRTIYLDAVVGGQVEERFVEEGATVTVGQPLVRLINEQQILSMLGSESSMLEQMNVIRTMRLALDQNELNLRQQLTELEYRVLNLRREYYRREHLAAREAIAQREFEEVRDELRYFEKRLELTRQSYRADSLSRSLQLSQMDGQMARLQQNLDLLRASFDNLTIRAPIDGQLSLLDAEIGESKGAGSRIGQIDDLSDWRVRAAIDEHYVSRVIPGLRAVAQTGGTTIALQVARVFPEIREGRFEVDLEFVGETPELRRGQTLRIRLELGDAEDAILIPRGPFISTTGGQWIYVITPDGSSAVRRNIRLGRQNPGHVEIIDGLEPGERVVTSSYESLRDADRLVIR